MTKITFSGAQNHPVTEYSDSVGKFLNIFKVTQLRENTRGEEKYISIDEYSSLVKEKLPTEIRDQVKKTFIAKTIKRLTPKQLTHPEDVVNLVAEQFKKSKQS